LEGRYWQGNLLVSAHSVSGAEAAPADQEADQPSATTLVHHPRDTNVMSESEAVLANHAALADRPFKRSTDARDVLDAEIRAGKLELTGPQNAVFRFLVEHTLYQPKDEADRGFVVESVLGVPAICKLTRLKQTAVKGAIKSLGDMGLIKTFKRPVMSGGRKPDRIRINWVLPEESLAVPSDEPGDDSSYETPAVPSYEPGDDSSIHRKQELLEELLQEGVGRDQGQTQNHGHPAGTGRALRAEFDSLLAECPDSLERFGGVISVRQSYGYFNSRPDIAGLREALALVPTGADTW
jgi:hypothetical protein